MSGMPVRNGLPASLLFACSENSVRSPMAEALAKRLYGQAVYVESVGVRAREVDGFVVAALDELGIDVHRHHAQTFEDVDPSSFDLIVTLSPEAHHRDAPLFPQPWKERGEGGLVRGDAAGAVERDIDLGVVLHRMSTPCTVRTAREVTHRRVAGTLNGGLRIARLGARGPGLGMDRGGGGDRCAKQCDRDKRTIHENDSCYSGNFPRAIAASECEDNMVHAMREFENDRDLT